MKNILTYALLLFSSFSFTQTVEPFLERIVSQFPNVRDVAMTQSKEEVVFSAQSFMGDISVLVSIKKVNDEWQQPKIVNFSGRYFDLEPFFSKDGLTLYFVSNRPLNQTSQITKDFDLVRK